MKIRFYEDYYNLCCEWCDTVNRVLWARIDEGVSCGACHKKLLLMSDCSLQDGKTVGTSLLN